MSTAVSASEFSDNSNVSGSNSACACACSSSSSSSLSASGSQAHNNINREIIESIIKSIVSDECIPERIVTAFNEITDKNAIITTALICIKKKGIFSRNKKLPSPISQFFRKVTLTEIGSAFTRPSAIAHMKTQELWVDNSAQNINSLIQSYVDSSYISLKVALELPTQARMPKYIIATCDDLADPAMMLGCSEKKKKDYSKIKNLFLNHPERIFLFDHTNAEPFVNIEDDIDRMACPNYTRIYSYEDHVKSQIFFSGPSQETATSSASSSTAQAATTASSSYASSSTAQAATTASSSALITETNGNNSDQNKRLKSAHH